MFLTKVGFNRDSNSNCLDLWIRMKRNISIFYIRHGVNNADQLNVIDILKKSYGNEESVCRYTHERNFVEPLRQVPDDKSNNKRVQYYSRVPGFSNRPFRLPRVI